MSEPTSNNHTEIIRIVGIGELGGKLINEIIKSPINNTFYIAMDTEQQCLDQILAHHKLLLNSEEQIEKAKYLLKGIDLLIIYVDLDNETDFNITQKLIQDNNTSFTIIAAKYLQKNQYVIERTEKLTTNYSCVVHFDLNKESEIYRLAKPVAENHLKERLIQFSKLPNLIISSGIINIDIADIKSVLSGMKNSYFIIESASGKNRIEFVMNKFIKRAKTLGLSFKINGVIINIQSGPDLSLEEIDFVIDEVNSICNEEATIIFGTSTSELDSENITILGILAY